MRFSDKVALITGGGSGIGLEAACQLVQEGAKVVINGRNALKLEQAAKRIDPSGQDIATLPGNIAEIETSVALVNKALDRFGRVDILLNNAGIFHPKPFLDIDEAEYEAFLSTILKGKFFAAQTAAKRMKKQDTGGVIINTGSMWAIQAIGATPSSAYSAANAGVHALVRNLAIELAPHSIRVNAVAPAVVETPVYETFMTPEEVLSVLPDFNAFHPIGRNGQATDVVAAILFLASEEASWITGAVLPVDGGVTAGRPAVAA